MNYLIYFEGDIIWYYDIYKEKEKKKRKRKKEKKKECNVNSYFCGLFIFNF